MTVTEEYDELNPDQNAAHAARLTLCTSQRERVEYVCEVLSASGSLQSGDVLDFLELYGYLKRREQQKRHVYTLVSNWRKARGLADTGDSIPALTPEMLRILDERASASETVSADPRPSLALVRSSETTDTDTSNTDSSNTDTSNTDTSNTDTSNTDHERAELEMHEQSNAVTVDVREHEQPQISGTNTSRKTVEGSRGFYLVAFMSLLVSVDTSWRFFGDKLGITDFKERVAMFAIVEVALIACGFAMRAGVRSESGKPGPARLILWALCAVSGYMAFDLAGPVSGLARVVLGPVLGGVMLHLALGIEIRSRHSKTSAWSRVMAEYRERFLSRLGLGDDDRTALQRTRERAARRLAYLATARGWVPFKSARMRRANRIANIAHDPNMKAQVEREHHSLVQLEDLKDVKHGAFWNGQ